MVKQLPQKLCHYLIDHDPTEQDLATLQYWQAVFKFEEERVARVLKSWEASPFKRLCTSG